MRTKSVAGVVALTVCAGLALTVPAGAGSGAATKVTIKSGGEFGYVSSPKPEKCANNRKVTVWQQKGGEQGGGDDIKKATDTTSPNGDRFMWSVGQPGLTGKVYARAGKKPGCQADNSRTIPAN